MGRRSQDSRETELLRKNAQLVPCDKSDENNDPRSGYAPFILGSIRVGLRSGWSLIVVNQCVFNETSDVSLGSRCSLENAAPSKCHAGQKGKAFLGSKAKRLFFARSRFFLLLLHPWPISHEKYGSRIGGGESLAFLLLPKSGWSDARINDMFRESFLHV